MKKMTKKELKKWCKKHKEEIISGSLTCVAVFGVTTILIKHRKAAKIKDIIDNGLDFKPFAIARKDKIEIPVFNNMSCLDAAKDGKKGLVVWLDDCSLDKMGELGSNLSKFKDGVFDKTVATMVCLWDYSEN